MPIFQPPIPNYEQGAHKVIAGVESGCGLFGLWPRPVYQGDTRTSPCAEGSGGFLGLGGLFSAPQPSYTTTPPLALTTRSEKPQKPER